MREENFKCFDLLIYELYVEAEDLLHRGIQKSYIKKEENISDITLTRGNLKGVRNSINRLTRRYSAVFEVINILYESQGIQLEGSSKHINLRGYFFDMNAFFETLIGRLVQNCSEGYSIKDQYSLHDMFIYTSGFNPCHRKSPTPRPDFALMKEGRVVKLLNAKYRDLWGRSLPAKMLYHLAIYAVSGIGNKTATILYPTISDILTTAKIDINDPVSCGNIDSVILQPVNLEKVAELVSGDLEELMGYVMKIIG
ncbi:McrC family protein [Clostridium estertheticum]|uniref:McrC family protein n=1 Tax=Clostridium estertheticum TaxID=238834 RepID=UPI001C0CFB04|nr:McrC family protein [Clostridium estertheticum]MBU3171142.1 McrC family protein [Clostridium estertheticum]